MTPGRAPVAVEAGGRERTFSTSGSTGGPAVWWRPEHLLRREARMVADEIIGPVDRIVTFAPPSHLFGCLYGDVLAALEDVPVDDLGDDPLRVPALRRGERVLLVCLPATWQVLQRTREELAKPSRVVALHGTGPATPAARALAEALPYERFCPVEIFGSTETGAIAHRPMTGTGRPLPAWRTFPDVTLVTGDGRPLDVGAPGEHPLVVTSPRLARADGAARPPALHHTGDLITTAGPGAFHHTGRASRLVKVNGRRCDLAAVEYALQAACPYADVACVRVSDPVRGEHYEVLYSGPADAARIREGIRARAPGVPAPRAVRAVRRIARSETGKPLHTQGAHPR